VKLSEPARDCCGGFAREWRNGFGDHAGGWAAGSVEERRSGGEQLDGARLEGAERQQSGIGTKVEVFAGRCIRNGKCRIIGILGQSAPILRVGLGNQKEADVSAAAVADGRATG